MSRTIALKDAPGWVGSVGGAFKAAARRGAMSAAIRGVGIIITEIIPKQKPMPVDRGIYRAAWRAQPSPNGASIINDSPHAQFIENGVPAGNVKPGRAMIAALAEWAKRKGLVSGGESPTAVAFAIARSMQKRGIFANGTGFKIMAQAEPRLAKILAEEVREAIREELAKA